MSIKYSDLEINSAGIYAIVTSYNNKIYVGSTKCFRKRWNEHRSDLENNRHHSIYLQRSYAKYCKRIEFKILEVITDLKTLYVQEQIWLDKLKPFPPYGYNISRSALGNNFPQKTKQLIELMSKQWVVFSPSQEAYLIRNLNQFCKDHNLNSCTLGKIANNKGNIKFYKGWWCRRPSQEEIKLNKVIDITVPIKFKPGRKLNTKPPVISVHLNKNTDKWSAYAIHKEARVYIGSYKSKEEAITAQNSFMTSSIITQQQWLQSIKYKLKDPRSTYPGVKRNGLRYSARITVEGRQINLGTFDTPELAHQAYLINKSGQVQ